MAISAKHNSKFAPLSPVMVIPPYEWKILMWDENLQTNKHTAHGGAQYKDFILCTTMRGV